MRGEKIEKNVMGLNLLPYLEFDSEYYSIIPTIFQKINFANLPYLFGIKENNSKTKKWRIKS